MAPPAAACEGRSPATSRAVHLEHDTQGMPQRRMMSYKRSDALLRALVVEIDILWLQFDCCAQEDGCGNGGQSAQPAGTPAAAPGAAPQQAADVPAIMRLDTAGRPEAELLQQQEHWRWRLLSFTVLPGVLFHTLT